MTNLQPPVEGDGKLWERKGKDDGGPLFLYFSFFFFFFENSSQERGSSITQAALGPAAVGRIPSWKQAKQNERERKGEE